MGSKAKNCNAAKAACLRYSVDITWK